MARTKRVTVCTVAGCGRGGRITAGMCTPHYRRQRSGQPLDKPIRAKRQYANGRPTAYSACAHPGCEQLQRSITGRCPKHYQQATYTGLLDATQCSVAGCKRGVETLARGMCAAHIYRTDKYGDPLAGRAPADYRPRDGLGSVTVHGYRVLYRPKAPGVGRHGLIAEHRHIMQESLGRQLAVGETVHHKNGDKLDNRLVRGHEVTCPSDCCNLELWLKHQPYGQRVADQIKWALSILRKYAPTAVSDEFATGGDFTDKVPTRS